VTAAPIDAVADTAGPINGTTGSTNVVNVLSNDTLNGTPVTPSDVTLTTVIPNTNLVLNPDGTVSVLPNTPAGTYTLTYQICEKLNPSNCDTAVVTVTVTAAPIDAVADTAGPINGTTGSTNVVNVLSNDTLNGTPVTPSDVTLTTVIPNTNLVLNPDGTVSVLPNTPAGTYTLTYQICEKLNPSNCDTAVVTVTVTAAPIDAVADTIGSINGSTGSTNAGNVLVNDTLNGTPVNPSDVVLTSTPQGPLTINTDGTIVVAPGTPAGIYTVDYTICEILNPTNCDTVTVTVTVTAGTIDAVNDAGTPVNGTTGGTAVANVLTNDTLNGVAVNPADVT
ncbi:gliding motility-associated C-terminal domain-containing protein, partial [Flavobacterium sp. HXWNR69]|nr:gliding motility-associated C-terminal domain-containing protein [Flavobacterium sp. HXWNR69]